MSRQVQIRRGTATEHNEFIGAIGEITMDTTNKTIRVHDGQTPGGTKLARQDSLDAADYVIETQLPTAENNYTWYRKYKSGWVEQGGRIYSGTSNASYSVLLPVTMLDINYCAISNTTYSGNDASAYGLCIKSKTQSSFSVGIAAKHSV